jgi:hypothetical protein
MNHRNGSFKLHIGDCGQLDRPGDWSPHDAVDNVTHTEPTTFCTNQNLNTSTNCAPYQLFDVIADPSERHDLCVFLFRFCFCFCFCFCCRVPVSFSLPCRRPVVSLASHPKEMKLWNQFNYLDQTCRHTFTFVCQTRQRCTCTYRPTHLPMYAPTSSNEQIHPPTKHQPTDALSPPPSPPPSLLAHQVRAIRVRRHRCEPQGNVRS